MFWIVMKKVWVILCRVDDFLTGDREPQKPHQATEHAGITIPRPPSRVNSQYQNRGNRARGHLAQAA